MKKHLLAFAVIGTLAWALTACEFNTPAQQEGNEQPGEEQKAEVIPSAFVKKHLIEEFTGQTCGYCPYGMDCIHEFVGDDPNWILVLHHYGYQADNFSVAGSATITGLLRVSGAPNVTVNREKVRTSEGYAVVYHPAELPVMNKSQFADSTYASVVINNSYDASSNVLTVSVSGALCKEDYPDLKLTVLVKESGMIGRQADYYYTFEGWEEFCHTNAVRVYLTEPTGDAITVDSTRHYQAEYAVKMKDKWNADNCMVVAFLSEDFQPVVQAEQQPVVAGTTGGAEILHGGITPVAVPDYYPEPNATAGPAYFSGNQPEEISVALAYYTPNEASGVNYWTIMAYTPQSVFSAGNSNYMPFTYIYLYTALDQTTIPEGDYPFEMRVEAGKACAGYRIDQYQALGGSTFYFIDYSYFQQGYLVPGAEWLITSGTLHITKQGWSVSGTARNGSTIELNGTSPIVNRGIMNAPKLLKRL